MGLNHIVLILLGLTALWFFIKQGMLVAELKAKLKARAESRSPFRTEASGGGRVEWGLSDAYMKPSSIHR
jgi:hypothetical protein